MHLRLRIPLFASARDFTLRAIVLELQISSRHCVKLQDGSCCLVKWLRYVTDEKASANRFSPDTATTTLAAA